MTLLRMFSIARRLLLFAAIFSTAIALVLLAMMNVVDEVRDVGVEQAGEAALEGQKAALRMGVDSMARALSAAVKDVPERGKQDAIVASLVNAARYDADRSGYYFVFAERSPLRPRRLRSS